MVEPMRMCVVCRGRFPQRELLRVALDKQGNIVVGGTKESGGKKAPGRGAYICNSPECRAKLVKTKALSRAFKREVKAETYNEAEACLSKKDGD